MIAVAFTYLTLLRSFSLRGRESCLLVANCPSNMVVYLRDGPAQTSLYAVRLR